MIIGYMYRTNISRFITNRRKAQQDDDAGASLVVCTISKRILQLLELGNKAIDLFDLVEEDRVVRLRRDVIHESKNFPQKG